MVWTGFGKIGNLPQERSHLHLSALAFPSQVSSKSKQGSDCDRSRFRNRTIRWILTPNSESDHLMLKFWQRTIAKRRREVGVAIEPCPPAKPSGFRRTVIDQIRGRLLPFCNVAVHPHNSIGTQTSCLGNYSRALSVKQPIDRGAGQSPPGYADGRCITSRRIIPVAPASFIGVVVSGLVPLVGRG